MKQFNIYHVSNGNMKMKNEKNRLHSSLVVITTAQLPSIKPELRFCTDSNPAHCVLENCDDENIWQSSQL